VNSKFQGTWHVAGCRLHDFAGRQVGRGRSQRERERKRERGREREEREQWLASCQHREEAS